MRGMITFIPVVGGDGSSLNQAEGRADRGSSTRRAPVRHIWSAMRRGFLADRWPADAAPPFKIVSSQRPISPGGVAGCRRRSRELTGRPYYLRAPDAKPPKDPLVRRGTADGTAMTWLSEWWSGGTAVIEPASSRDAARLGNCMAHSVSTAAGRRRIRGHADRAQYARSPAQTGAQDHRLCGVAHGRRRGGVIVDRHRCDPTRPWLVAQPLLEHLGHLAGRGVRKVFLEVEENNRPARAPV